MKPDVIQEQRVETCSRPEKPKPKKQKDGEDIAEVSAERAKLPLRNKEDEASM